MNIERGRRRTWSQDLKFVEQSCKFESVDQSTWNTKEEVHFPGQCNKAR